MNFRLKMSLMPRRVATCGKKEERKVAIVYRVKSTVNAPSTSSTVNTIWKSGGGDPRGIVPVQVHELILGVQSPVASPAALMHGGWRQGVAIAAAGEAIESVEWGGRG